MNERRVRDRRRIVDLDDCVPSVVDVRQTGARSICAIQICYISCQAMSPARPSANNVLTPCRVVDVAPIVPSIKERGPGILVQRHVYRCDMPGLAEHGGEKPCTAKSHSGGGRETRKTDGERSPWWANVLQMLPRVTQAQNQASVIHVASFSRF